MADAWMLMETSPGDARAPFVARFESIGRTLPEHRVTTAEVMESTRHHTRIDLERLTGIHERRVVGEGENSVTLATDAALDCLEHSDHTAADLDVIVNCSITKYRDGLVSRYEPTQSQAVAQAIGAPQAMTFDLSNACAGMLTGVFVLNNWIRRGTIRRGMVVSGECISGLGHNAAAHVRHILSREMASLTLGDAGVAAIIERAPNGVPGIRTAGFTTLSEHSRLCLAYPARREPGARMFTRARAIHQAAISSIPPLLRETLDAAGLEMSDIDWVIPHQTSARAIRKGMAEVSDALEDAPKHPAVVTVDQFGNTASTTHFVALYQYLQDGLMREGERVALLALASGLEIGTVIFTVDEMVARYGHEH
ncbi:MAG: 3-oxoacyl-ACP synthase III family protein [Acidimicrobiia bacterium]